jgi:hypothetical protein
MNLRLRPAREDEAGKLTELALRSKRAWGYDDAFMTAIMPDMLVHAEYLRDEHGIVPNIMAIVSGIPSCG